MGCGESLRWWTVLLIGCVLLYVARFSAVLSQLQPSWLSGKPGLTLPANVSIEGSLSKFESQLLTPVLPKLLTPDVPQAPFGGPPYWDHRSLFVSPDTKEDPRNSETSVFEASFPEAGRIIPNLNESGNWSQMQPFLNKIVNGEPVRIAIVGGSVPVGTECVETKWNEGVPIDNSSLYACAYIVRLKYWLQSISSSNITLLNFCQRSWTSCGHMDAIAGHWREAGGDIDLMVLDTFANDMVSPDGRCFETLIRVIYTLSSNVALLGVVLMSPLRYLKLQKTVEKAWRSHQNILANYAIARVDFIDIMVTQNQTWLWETNPKTGLGMNSHPGWRSHQLISDVLSNAMGRYWSACCLDGIQQTPTPRPKKLPVPYHSLNTLMRDWPCLDKISQFSSLHPDKSTGVVSGNWELYEDVPGKPGWIATREDQTILFPLTFGEVPILYFTFLRSYENMGGANVSLLSNPHKVKTFQGLWDGNLSDLSKHHSMAHNGIMRGELNFPANGSDTLVVKAIPGQGWTSHRKGEKQPTPPWMKFKILEVSSC